MSKILIVDDEEDVREELKDRVSSMGHEHDDCASQEEARRLLEKGRYDLEVLDLAIPVKYEGVARVEHGKNLLQRIVSGESPPPVIVVTANGLDG